MTINQVQLNHIIDLLGDWVFALRFNLINPVKVHNIDENHIKPSDADQSIPDIHAATNAYYKALSELYVDQEIPPVFTKQLMVIGFGGSSNYSKLDNFLLAFAHELLIFCECRSVPVLPIMSKHAMHTFGRDFRDN